MAVPIFCGRESHRLLRLFWGPSSPTELYGSLRLSASACCQCAPLGGGGGAAAAAALRSRQPPTFLMPSTSSSKGAGGGGAPFLGHQPCPAAPREAPSVACRRPSPRNGPWGRGAQSQLGPVVVAGSGPGHFPNSSPPPNEPTFPGGGREGRGGRFGEREGKAGALSSPQASSSHKCGAPSGGGVGEPPILPGTSRTTRDPPARPSLQRKQRRIASNPPGAAANQLLQAGSKQGGKQGGGRAAHWTRFLLPQAALLG